MTYEQLIEKMRSGEATFKYKKKSTGEVREARGTLNLSMVPEDHQPKGVDSDKKVNDTTQAYYDLDKQGWRSFDKSLLVG